MKIIPLAEARDSLSSYVEEAQNQAVLITRHGRPAVVMVGVDGEDLEDLLTRSDKAFWEMIRERRKPGRKTYSSDEVRARLGVGRKR
jgi:prevent-host-death family protein